MEKNNGELPSLKKWGCVTIKNDTPEEIQNKLDFIQSQLKIYEEKDKNPDDMELQIGEAFVTFQWQGDTRAVDQRFTQKYIIQHYIKKIFSSTLGKLIKTQKERRFNGKLPYAIIPPDPSDIYWENLGTDWITLLKLQTATWIITFIVLGGGFGVLIAISEWQKTMSSSGSSHLTSLIPSLFIAVINAVLKSTVRKLAEYERHETWTEFTNSIALKLTISQTIASGALTLVINNTSSDKLTDWFAQGGLVDDITYILLTDAIVTPLLKFIDFNVIISWVKRKLFQIQILKDVFITQAEANMLYEDPQLDIAQTHAQLMKTLAVTLVYAPLIPMSFVISSLGIFLTYWADKYNLLRRQSRPLRLSEVLNDDMIDNIPYILVLYSALGWYFYTELNTPAEDYLLAAFIISIIYVVFPIHNFLSLCFQDKVALYEDKYGHEDFKYENQALNFTDDFDRSNPVTTNLGWDRYYDLMELKNPEKKEEIAQNKKTFSLNKVGLADRLNMYAGSSVPISEKNKAMFGGIKVGKKGAEKNELIGQMFAANKKTNAQQNKLFNAPGGKNKQQGINLFKPKYTAQKKQKSEKKQELASKFIGLGAGAGKQQVRQAQVKPDVKIDMEEGKALDTKDQQQSQQN